MRSIATSIWNEIEKTQSLSTDWAQRMFLLDEEKMPVALEAERKHLIAQGHDNSVVLAFHTLAPLLWEREAIAAFVEDRPNLFGALPNIETIEEALHYAVGDYRLDGPQQLSLANLLRNQNDAHRNAQENPKFGADNKIFTKERADEAREILRKKLNLIDK